MIAPQTIIGGRYRVVRALGGGGMKLVYLAEDLRLAARKCALAEMVDSFTSVEAQKQAITAFQREADMLAQLSNEHIPRVFDRFSDGNHHFLVMEYIDGSTLEEQIKQHGGKLRPEEVVEVALQVLDTLDYLHHLQPPVIYRDLKPSNIMVTGDGLAKLIDFGIARLFQPLSNATMIGTQGYAPPEQYRGKVETRSDIYALGATMHHAISGRDPAAEAPFSFPPLQKLCPDIDAHLANAVDQALAYDVTSRLPDAAEFRHRLLQIGVGTALGGSPGNGHGSSARTQLRLPLTDSAAQPATALPPGNQRPGRLSAGAMEVGPTGPTILSATAEITCGECTRRIPADSRFCSYCACDLRWLTPSRPAAANDETVVLSRGESPENLRNPSVGTYAPPPHQSVSRRRHRRLKRPFLLILLISGAGLTAVKLIRRIPEAINPAPPGYGEGYEGHDSMPPARAANPSGGDSDNDEYGSALERDRLAKLRARLDAQGYSEVKFRIDGDTLILYGNVRSDYDRLAVQAICFATVGLTSVSDDLRITGADPED